MLQLLEEAAREAGRTVKNGFKFGGKIKATEKTSYKDIVTEVDIASQEIIRKKLTEGMPKVGFHKDQLGFVGEESLNIEGEHKFIIDPIDGTTNYSSGIDFVCISIAYAVRDQVVEGVVYDPIRDHLYKASLGKGAYLVGNKGSTKLSVGKTGLNQAVVAVHFNAATFDRLIEVYRTLIPKLRGARCLGSLTLDLCLLAGGGLDGVINGNAYPWDMAAADLIIRESGGRVATWDGREYKIDFLNSRSPAEIIAGQPEIFDLLLAEVRGN